MKQENKKQTEELTQILRMQTLIYFRDNLDPDPEKMVNIGDILDIVLSAHISSFSILMREISEDNIKLHKKVEEFLKNFMSKLSEVNPFISIEIEENEGRCF